MAEHDGFKVGDTVKVVIKGFDKRETAEIRRNKEVPEGAIGKIVKFIKNGFDEILAVVDIEGVVRRFYADSYLELHNATAI